MKIIDGVNLNVIPTQKFKDIGISIRFQNELKNETAAARSLLALMLCDRCKVYDTKEKMTKKQDELYGAVLGTQTLGYGKSHVIEFRCKVIHPLYVTNEDSHLKNVFSFLKEIIFHPLLNEEVFEESKKVLISKSKRMIDDPSQLVISEGLKAAGTNTPLGISSLGELKHIEKLCLQDVQNAYTSMLNEDCIQVLVCGDVLEKEIFSYVKNFPFKERSQKFASYYVVSNDDEKQKKYMYKNISQSYLMMVWFTNISLLDTKYYALRLANAVLGQYSSSLLFQEVREKRSLCYTIYSNIISYDGVLGVTTGIEKEHIDEVIELIREQIDVICQGDFSDELLEISRKMIINSIKSGRDNMNTLMAQEYQNILLNREWDTKIMIEHISKVTKEDVCEVMQLCKEKMVFVLTKEDSDEKDC